MNIDPNKLNLVAERLGYVAMRLEGVEALTEPTARADDWDGSKHPRGPDGKFVSMGGGGGSAKLHDALDSYVGGLKGKKGSTAALIKHLLQNEVPENEIFAAAKHMYGLTDDKKSYVSWYHKDMKKNGINVPDIVKGGDHLSELASKTSTVGEVNPSVLPKELQEKLAEPKVEPEVAKALEAKSEGGLGGDHVGEIPKTPVPKHDSYAASKMYNIATQEGTNLDEKIQALAGMTGYTGKDGAYQTELTKFLMDAKGAGAKSEELPAEDAPDMLPDPTTQAQKQVKTALEAALPDQGYSPAMFIEDYENKKFSDPADQAFLDKALEIAKKKVQEANDPAPEGDEKLPDPKDPIPLPAANDPDQAAFHVAATDPDETLEAKIHQLEEADDSQFDPEAVAYKNKLLAHLKAKMYDQAANGQAAEAPAPGANDYIEGMPTKQDPTGTQSKLLDWAQDPDISAAAKIEDLKSKIKSGYWSTETAEYAQQLLDHIEAKAGVKAAEPEAPAADAWKPHENHTGAVDQIVNNPNLSLADKIEQLKATTTGYGTMAQKEYAAAKLHEMGQPYETSSWVKDSKPILGMKIAEPTTPGGGQIKTLVSSPHTTLESKMKQIASIIDSSNYSPATKAYAHEAMAELSKLQGTGKHVPSPASYKGTTVFKNKVEALAAQFHKPTTSATMKDGIVSKISAMMNQGSNEGNKKYATDVYDSLMKGTTKYDPGELGAKPAVPPPGKPPEVKKTPAPPMHKLSPEVKKEYETNKTHWAQILPQNKPPVEAMQKALDEAFNKPTAEEQAEAVKAIQAIPSPQGMGQTSANQFLDKVKQQYGVAEKGEQHPHVGVASSTLPTGASQKLQDAIYNKAKDAPPKYVETVHKLQDANGNKVKAKLVADTENIPDDFYAKVTAAYGNEHNGMTQAVDNAMLKYADKVQDRLTGAQKSALSSYQGSGYHAINDALRGKATPSASTQKIINDIKAAINSNYVPADTPVYRGLNSSLKALTGFDDPQQAVGRTFEHKNFASVSRSQQTAAGFGTTTILHFTVPAGTPGVVMPKQNWEREIVLNARSMFKVDKVEQKVVNGHTRHIVHCTYLGTRED